MQFTYDHVMFVTCFRCLVFVKVNASYQVIHPSSISNLDKVFSCTQYHGVVAPEGTTKIKVCSTEIFIVKS